jgi:glycosyltransferase involved in cell wall biosynthesis
MPTDGLFNGWGDETNSRSLKSEVMVSQGLKLHVSVIVPFLDEERWLPSCIAALEAQTLDYSSYELLFVDNGSTDRSLGIVRSHPQIKLIKETRRDPYLARNRGIIEAQGNYLVFLDADCIPRGDWLELLCEEIKDAGASIVLGYVGYPENASIFVRCYERYYDQKLRHLIENGLTQHYFGHAGNMAVRAEVFQSLGLFKAMPVVGDTEIIHRLLKQELSATIRYAEKARVVHAEVSRFRQCLKKLFECGQYSETLREIDVYQLLPLRGKFHILRRCLRGHRDNPGQVLAMLATLGAGTLFYSAGRLVQAWRSMRLLKF